MLVAIGIGLHKPYWLQGPSSGFYIFHINYHIHINSTTFVLYQSPLHIIGCMSFGNKDEFIVIDLFGFNSRDYISPPPPTGYTGVVRLQVGFEFRRTRLRLVEFCVWNPDGTCPLSRTPGVHLFPDWLITAHGAVVRLDALAKVHTSVTCSCHDDHLLWTTLRLERHRFTIRIRIWGRNSTYHRSSCHVQVYTSDCLDGLLNMSCGDAIRHPDTCNL